MPRGCLSWITKFKHFTNINMRVDQPLSQVQQWNARVSKLVRRDNDLFSLKFRFTPINPTSSLGASKEASYTHPFQRWSTTNTNCPVAHNTLGALGQRLGGTPPRVTNEPLETWQVKPMPRVWVLFLCYKWIPSSTQLTRSSKDHTTSQRGLG
jgi:hypothetical protein